MGSISLEDYIQLQNELNSRYKDIIFLNKYLIRDFLKDDNDYYRSLIVPKNYSNDFIFISKSYNSLSSLEFNNKKIHFLFGHYILKEINPEDLRICTIHAFKNIIEHSIIPLQRRWKEYYYKPDGPYIFKNLDDICNRNGFLK